MMMKLGVIFLSAILAISCKKSPKYNTSDLMSEMPQSADMKSMCASLGNGESSPGQGIPSNQAGAAPPNGLTPPDGAPTPSSAGQPSDTDLAKIKEMCAKENLGNTTSKDITLQPSQVISFKVPGLESQNPTGDLTWKIESGSPMFASSQGKIVEHHGSFYLSLSVLQAASVGSKAVLNIYPVNDFTNPVMTLPITIKTQTAVLADEKSTICSVAGRFSPDIQYSPEEKQPVQIYDNGSGISRLSCSFLIGGSWKIYKCFVPELWPTNWRSYEFKVTLTNRCGLEKRATFFTSE